MKKVKPFGVRSRTRDAISANAIVRSRAALLRERLDRTGTVLESTLEEPVRRPAMYH